MTCPYCKRPFEGESCPKKRCRDSAKFDQKWTEKYAPQMEAYYSGLVRRASGSRMAEERGAVRRNGMHGTI